MQNAESKGIASLSSNLDSNQSQALRQLGICNSCRYCEGYCATFQALTRYRQFDQPTINHMANLCHNCRGCYYACQYTAPHEFDLNIPALLANIRADNWEQHIKPLWLSRVMQRHVWPYIVLCLLFIVLFAGIFGLPWLSAKPFYASISHTLMVVLFTPLFLIPLFSLVAGIRRYWQSIGGNALSFNDIKVALGSAARMKNLDGGQGQGCNYEAGERYSSWRRWAHQATMYGFLLCYASTSTAALYHYLFALQAPYAFFSLPKLFGVSGGVLLSVGTALLFWLKLRADPELGVKTATMAEYVFIALLFLVSTSGLLLYGFSGTVFAGFWLIIHLALVATFFLSIPYSKMVHGFFRMASLCREAQLKRYTDRT